MSGTVLSINTLSASHDNLCVSIKLTTMKRKATMKTMFSVLCGLAAALPRGTGKNRRGIWN
jgi:hypothetical protein